MYKVTNGETVKSAFTMKQAFYFAEDINRDPTTRLEETNIELPDGCVLVYDPSHGDLVCKSPTQITFATPSQAAKIFGFFFEGVERGWIDLSYTPQMRDLHDWLVTKQGCKKCVDCDDTGWRDSGGFQPWGEPILLLCDCETGKSL